MANKWNHLLSVAVIVTLCAFVPRCLPAQTSGRTGTSGTGTTGTGTTGTGASGTGQSGEIEIAGQMTGNERFLRQNRDPGQLVGGSSQGVGNLRGQTDATGQGASGMFGNQGGFNNFNSMNNLFNAAGMYNSLSRQRQQLRVPLRLGPNSFPFSAAAPAATATGPNLRVQSRLARIPQLKDRGAVQVEMEGKVAVLRGAVASQHEWDLIERLVLLEPGIENVRNELQVAPPLPAP